MTTPPENHVPAEVETTRRLQRKEWLLAGYQQAFGHELPNRLVAIQGLARLVLSHQAGRLEPAGRELLERLADLAQRTDRLVRSLAEIARLDHAPEQAEPVALAGLVSEVIAEVKLLFNPQPVEYIIQGPMPTVVVARRGLYTVLYHLLRNASRAVQANPEARVEVGARRTPDGSELWVVDNGCGLSAAQQLHLFEPFHADPASEGQGLGLFLVRQVVVAWNGSVGVQSEPGRGATFTIRLP